MQVKCYLAPRLEDNESMRQLLATTRGPRGATSLGALTNDINGISLSKDGGGALILVGGRDSIIRFLYNQGNVTRITGITPLLVTFARKHRVFGKNETCVKLVSGPNHAQPEDGTEFKELGGGEKSGYQVILAPAELGHILWALYGWG